VSITGRLFETFKASILDLPYLIIDEPSAAPCRDAAQPRVGRIGSPRGAQAVKAFDGLLSLGLKPRMRADHAAFIG